MFPILAKALFDPLVDGRLSSKDDEKLVTAVASLLPELPAALVGGTADCAPASPPSPLFPAAAGGAGGAAPVPAAAEGCFRANLDNPGMVKFVNEDNG